MYNPLCEPIFDLLLEQKTFKIHSLYDALQNRGVVTTQDDNPQRDLFKKNFLIMNALFQLRAQLQQEGWSLLISTLNIELLPSSELTLCSADPLEAYYADWTNFDTSEAEINALFDQFWQNMAFQQQMLCTDISLDTIHSRWALPTPLTHRALQKRWRALALEFHPDRTTGDVSIFQRLEHEYQLLKTFVANLDN
ncbi:molecular chaperone DnaJ [Pseudoalteromonas xiamenensis]|uniref:DNA-J related domain-containing protein n=1 Tax=Pseudoalteromonas xiamenensis TaxID=882626 RepID=UPI0027E52BDD|nr:DNA-J related domain-containing protein [Pseudoalteromonas xiamenensis]WMN58490.1 molecular chaperone DnaJ [Pseudoalteromonas xiamenensis]